MARHAASFLEPSQLTVLEMCNNGMAEEYNKITRLHMSRVISVHVSLCQATPFTELRSSPWFAVGTINFVARQACNHR